MSTSTSLVTPLGRCLARYKLVRYGGAFPMARLAQSSNIITGRNGSITYRPTGTRSFSLSEPLRLDKARKVAWHSPVPSLQNALKKLVEAHHEQPLDNREHWLQFITASRNHRWLQHKAMLARASSYGYEREKIGKAESKFTSAVVPLRKKLPWKRLDDHATKHKYMKEHLHEELGIEESGGQMTCDRRKLDAMDFALWYFKDRPMTKLPGEYILPFRMSGHWAAPDTGPRLTAGYLLERVFDPKLFPELTVVTKGKDSSVVTLDDLSSVIAKYAGPPDSVQDAPAEAVRGKKKVESWSSSAPAPAPAPAPATRLKGGIPGTDGADFLVWYFRGFPELWLCGENLVYIPTSSTKAAETATQRLHAIADFLRQLGSAENFMHNLRRVVAPPQTERVQNGGAADGGAADGGAADGEATRPANGKETTEPQQ